MITLTPEQLNEIKQWLSLGHSKKEICKLYDLSYSQVLYLANKFCHYPNGEGPGRYRLSDETIEAILKDLDDVTKLRKDIALVRQVNEATVSILAKKHGKPPRLRRQVG